VSDDTEATDDASWLRSLLERRRPDPGPVSGRWALGVGDMVADRSLTPGKLRGLARKLNHFGGVAISEDAVEWADVEAVRTRSLIEYLFTGGVDKQIDKLPVPWFPFRRKVLGAISRAALTLLLAAVVLADPAVRACFEATAQAHGVTVCPADDDVMHAISARIRSLSDLSLSDR
jgi:hypothetical protein